MPIYAYKCSSCGFAKDVLQKISDAPLTQCPSCGADQFQKQVTAAGFQLKGSGWYVTDFKGGNTSSASASSEGGDGAAKGSDSSATAPAVSTPTAASTPPSTAPASSDA